MPKKVFDIVPPKMREKIEESAKIAQEETGAVSIPKKSVSRAKLPRRAKKSPAISAKTWLYLSCAAVFGILLVYFYFGLQKTNVQIWPKTETLSYSENLKVDKNVQDLDADQKIIPGFVVSESGELTQEFPATGNASNEGKAKGTIVVYNKYTPAAPITLKVGTHFLSDSGKYYIALNKIAIPAATIKSGKTVPGSVEVAVEAEEGGEAYNIGPAKFSVPKLAGTAYYYSIYAESVKEMSGGYASDVKKVSEDDIAGAEEALSEKIYEDLIAKMKSKNSSDYVYLDGAFSKKITDSSSSVKKGTTADNFNYTVKATVSAVVFKKSDTEKFGKDYINGLLEDDRAFLDSSLQMSWQVENANIADGKMNLAVDFSGKTYSAINKIGLVSEIAGKQKNQISEIISQTLGDKISDSRIEFSPFWTRKSPKNQNKIRLDLKFE